ncbi:MAG TPA: hypothetical protein VEV40_03975, partial [Alloacidobacterium sp.]|nr:hypothetical protein [Alloacidobacterium sp.]
MNTTLPPSMLARVLLQRLAIVVPCYNEEEVLPETASCLESLIQELIAAGLVREVSLYFIDDG